MSKSKSEQQAFDHFKSGFCCSESVFKTISEVYGDNTDDSLTKLASGLVGGIGSSHEETCGALTGGILALGYLYGRTNPDADTTKLKEMAVEFRQRFLKQFDSTNCGVLLDRFGEQPEFHKCRDLTSKAAGILAELLEEYK